MYTYTNHNTATTVGGYTSMDRHMQRFWSVVEEFNEADRAALLKFITSCERPPSLGFIALQVSRYDIYVLGR